MSGTATVRQDELVFDFDDERGGPATWGQQSNWATIHATAGADALFNFDWSQDLEPGLGLAGVRQAIVSLLHEHEGLRTTFRVRPDGSLEQLVAGSGSVDFAVLDLDATADPDAETDRVLAELAARPFEHGRELPARFRLLLREGAPCRLLFLLCHMAVDEVAFGVVVDRLSALLGTGATAPPAGRAMQPLELAALEAEPRARARSDRALDYWRRNLPALAGTYPPPARRVTGQRWARVEFSSARMSAQATATARRENLPDAVVYLTAVYSALIELSGSTSAGLLLVCSNRRAGTAGLVASLAQDALCRVDFDGADYPERLRRVRLASLAAYAHSYYEPAAMRRAIGASGGPGSDFRVVFNDLRAAGLDRHRPAPESVPRFTGGLDSFDCQILLCVEGTPANSYLSAIIDTAHLDRGEIGDFLRAVERSVLSGAQLPVPEGQRS